ncbi:MAG: hypothetical protein MK207_15005 [Saprospiraceae bacterium]|nr:hypothetical protein [Saprospiraceae bacterium]
MSKKLEKLQENITEIKKELDRYLSMIKDEASFSNDEVGRLIEMQNMVEAIEYRIAEITIQDQTITILTKEEVQKALLVNKKYKNNIWKQIGDVLGVPGVLGPVMIESLAKFQKAKGLGKDGILGDFTFQWLALHPSGKGKGLESLIKNEDVLYIGMRHASRKKEGAIIENTVGKKHSTLILGSQQENKIKVGEGMVDLMSNTGMDAFLNALINVSEAEKAILKRVIDNLVGNSKDEVATFIRQMNLAENGKKLFKRLVLSGHSDGWYIIGDGEQGLFKFDELKTVGDVFPNAFKQVEDLHIAGCNSGQESKLDQHLKMFPNLKTIWAYADFSPSPRTGSRYHIKKWLKGTDGRGEDKLEIARKDVSNDGGSKDKNVATYKVDSQEYNTDHTMTQWTIDRIIREIKLNEKFYHEAHQQGKMNMAGLRNLQSALQAYLGKPEAKTDFYYQDFSPMNKNVLLLRHWKQYNEHFIKHFGKQIKRGYDEIGKKVPDFIGMTRAETIKEFRFFKATGDLSIKTKELIYYYLIELEGESTWI